MRDSESVAKNAERTRIVKIWRANAKPITGIMFPRVEKGKKIQGRSSGCGAGGPGDVGRRIVDDEVD